MAENILSDTMRKPLVSVGDFQKKKIYAVDHPIPSNIGSKCFQSRRLKCRSKSYWQEQRWTQSNDNVPQSFTSGGQKLLTLRKSKKKVHVFPWEMYLDGFAEI